MYQLLNWITQWHINVRFFFFIRQNRRLLIGSKRTPHRNGIDPQTCQGESWSNLFTHGIWQWWCFFFLETWQVRSWGFNCIVNWISEVSVGGWLHSVLNVADRYLTYVFYFARLTIHPGVTSRWLPCLPCIYREYLSYHFWALFQYMYINLSD